MLRAKPYSWVHFSGPFPNLRLCFILRDFLIVLGMFAVNDSTLAQTRRHSSTWQAWAKEAGDFL